MKVLFTGATSFSGFWFVDELLNAGHEVVILIRRPLDAYQGVRRKRAESLMKRCPVILGEDFGSENFLQRIASEDRWDLFCHHAAEVGDYRNPSYDIGRAISSNTKNIYRVLTELQKRHCGKVILTGSVFEQNEGSGTDLEKAFSPYGCSKALTFEIFKQYALQMDFKLGKFVIPNPFGPYEEPRYTYYLMRTWHNKEKAIVKTPLYIRDNIPISLLKKCYVDFAHRLTLVKGIEKFNPSGYSESQALFTQRMAREISQRLPLECSFELGIQEDFSEPLKRVNTDLPDHEKIGWKENAAWDDLAEYYERYFKENV